jgi:hypothetical protein
LQTIDRFDGSSDGVSNSLQILAESDLGAGKPSRRHINLLPRGGNFSVCRAYLAPNPDDHARPLAESLADLSLPLLLAGEVPQPEVLERPVGHDIEVGPTREVGQFRADEVATSAECAATEPEPDGR